MKKHTTKRKLGFFVCLMFILPLGAFAQSTPNVYLCGTGQATFNPGFGAYTPVNGDQVIWTVDGVAGTPIVYNGSNSSLQTPANLAVGTHTYSVRIIPADANLCPGEASDNMIAEKLPVPAIVLSSPSATYCTDLSASTVITAALDNITLPAGVTMSYTWSATLDGTAVPDVSTLGSKNATGEKFTLSAGVAPGAYVFTAEASYTTGGVPIIPATSCQATSTQSITITPKPGKATITIAP